MFRVLLSTFFAFVIVLSPLKAEEFHKFSDGVSAFTCENEYQNFSFIILQRANHFHVVQNGKRLDADINPIEDGYYFEYLAGGNAYLRQVFQDKWNFRTLFPDGSAEYECETLTELVQSLATAIAPKILENANKMEKRLAHLESAIINLQAENSDQKLKIRELEDIINPIKDFKTSYYEMPGSLTTNLKGSRRFLQISVGMSTKYEQVVLENIENHLPTLKAAMLSTLSDYTEVMVAGREARAALENNLMDVLNAKLEELEGYGGIENLFLTSFIIQ